MKRIFSFIIFIFFLIGNSFGQVTDEETGNTIIGGFSWKTLDPVHLWSHMKDPITALNPKEEFLAIVLCSTDPLPVAIPLASHDVMRSIFEITPPDIEGYPEKTGEISVIGKNLSTIPRDGILLLRRTTGCGFVKNKPVRSTYWIIHPNNELPPFVEIRSAVGIEGYDIVYDENYFSENIGWKIPEKGGTYQNAVKLTPQVYKTALEKTASFLKEHRTAIATIKIPFFGKRPSQIIANRVLQAQKFLTDSGINKSRIYVRRISLNPNASNVEDSNKYPDISIVYEYKQPAANTTQKQIMED